MHVCDLHCRVAQTCFDLILHHVLFPLLIVTFIMAAIDNISCSICDKIFTKKKNLYAHQRNIHKIEPLLKNHISDSKYECDFCQQKFVSKSSVVRHIKNFHQNTNETHNQRRIICPCETCEKIFPSHVQLRQHLSNAHDITIEYDELEFNSIEGKILCLISDAFMSSQRCLKIIYIELLKPYLHHHFH